MIDHSQPLDAFLARQQAQDLICRSIALRDACRRGFGVWQHPNATRGSGRNTHLHEIDAFGISATGETAEQAVRNWFTVAYRIHHYETVSTPAAA